MNNIKFYGLPSEFFFGKFEGKTLMEVVVLQPSYINWCCINLDHFCIEDKIITQLKEINSDFKLTKEAIDKLKLKIEIYEKMRDEEYEENNRRDEYDAQYPSFEGWLEEEFGEDAEMVYWNLE